MFVIKFGKAEQIASWNVGKRRQDGLRFFSQPLPVKETAQQRNWWAHEGAVDLVISRDCVASIQTAQDHWNRYEQGVMVSMVDDEGKLIPEQGAGSLFYQYLPSRDP